MNEANRLGDRAKIAEGLDLLMTAPVYLEAGDRKAYEDFRADILDRHVPAESGLQAEHVLKVCLLTPADRRILERLESSARVCRENPRSKGGARGLPEWNALSLSLFHYRKDELREAIRNEVLLIFGRHSEPPPAWALPNLTAAEAGGIYRGGRNLFTGTACVTGGKVSYAQ